MSFNFFQYFTLKAAPAAPPFLNPAAPPALAAAPALAPPAAANPALAALPPIQLKQSPD